MQTVKTIGLDIAKSVFQVHGIDAEGKVVIRRQLKRRYVLAFFQKLAPCLVGIEACASTAPSPARECHGTNRKCENASTMSALGSSRTEYARCEPFRF